MGGLTAINRAQLSRICSNYYWEIIHSKFNSTFPYLGIKSFFTTNKATNYSYIRLVRLHLLLLRHNILAQVYKNENVTSIKNALNPLENCTHFNVTMMPLSKFRKYENSLKCRKMFSS